MPLLPLARLAFLGRSYFGAGEESRAKDAKGAKGAKVKGMEDDEIAGVVVGVEVCLEKALGSGMVRNWVNKGWISDRFYGLEEPLTF